MKKGYVYFVKHATLSPVKIGYTNQKLSIRLSEFRVFSPYGLELIGFIRTPHPEQVEKEIHSKLNSYQIRGEWYEVNHEIIYDIIDHYSKSDISKQNFYNSYLEECEIEDDYYDEMIKGLDEDFLKYIYTLGDIIGVKIYRTKHYNKFISKYNKDHFSSKRFKTSLDDYAEKKGYIINYGRDVDGRFTIFSKKNESENKVELIKS